jgi:predicted HicB family RNase H-like nuclease
VKAPRIGRPPLAKKERKATLLSVRLTEEERREVERAAKAAGVGLSEWARRVLLTAAG